MPDADQHADLRFYFDPVCPFAWLTSKWVRQVAAARGYVVDWRFISLRMVNEQVDYDQHFPPGYEAGHTAGLRLLRVAAKARRTLGPEAVDRFYAALGKQNFDTPPPSPLPDTDPLDYRGAPSFVAPVLAEARLPEPLVEALEDSTLDADVRAETDEALALAGKDVGTPIIQVDPPEGLAFFGPVISRLPDEEASLELWDHVVALTRFPGFAELKRSLRERPRLRALETAD
ncbi:MAG TPA: hypothetical protein VFM09_15210 [Marmoricola sp.]|nr:hypothetical protein [Marmoricola sp.]